MPPSPTAVPKEKKPKKPAKAAAVPPPVEPDPVSTNEEQRPIIHPMVACDICTGDNAITAEVAKRLLEWETENEYAKRLADANPGLKDSDVYIENGKPTTFGNAKKFGDVFMLTDEDKQKVRCWNNRWNRDFDHGWSLELAQSILNGQWAGPLTISEQGSGVLHPQCDPYTKPDGTVVAPGETFSYVEGTINGSSIAISRTGRVESGQHSLVAVVLANQMWWKNRKAYPFWENSTTGPVIETAVFTGLSESRKVLMTVDHCRARTEADVFYTSDIKINGESFSNLPSTERKELSRMLAAAVDLLWKRTETKGYKTHPEAVAFVDRHPKIVKCLEHLYDENSAKGGRKISNLRLSAGQSAALCYLMGCSGDKTDGDLYRNGFPPTEKGLDWSLFQKAKDFWAMVGSHADLLHVRAALAALKDGDPESETNTGLGGRLSERLCIIQKAWDVVKQGRNPEPDELVLTYSPPAEVKQKDGSIKFVPAKLEDIADFGGIDVPDKVLGGSTVETPFSPEQIEQAKEDQRVKRAEEDIARTKAMMAGKNAPTTAPKPVAGPTTATPTKK